MHGQFLLEAGVLLGALSLAAWVFLGLRQSVIPAYILTGMLLRPWVGQSPMVEALATLGVVLLLFFMGLEFSLSALLRDRVTIMRTGMIDLLTSFPLGLAVGLALGVGWTGALLLAGGFYISSSAIVAKSVIDMRRSADPEASVALGILVFEDLFMALFLALLSGAVLASHPSVGTVSWGVGKAMIFFGVVLLAAHFGRGVLERIFDRESDDLFILMVGSLLLLLSWLAVVAGLSEAIGAFLAGLALAETRQRARAEHLFAPLQGLFAAIFFLAFGLSLDPGSFGGVWPQALLLAVLAIASKLAGGWWAGRRSGLGQRGALSLGLMLVARGEFSVILAGIAVAVGQHEVGAMLALLVLILSVVGTMAVRYAPQASRWLFPRRTPRSLEELGFSPGLAAFDPEGGPRRPGPPGAGEIGGRGL